ncbi:MULTISPECIES: FGGY family carbohydrate kinase [unclassified Mesorhizobium]|uniref:xylulokinase n=1 Tax=unclassified Mesorhizobium TaxID=325217 RepID=UPI0024155C5E|nr:MULTISPECIES: FGGY family carbohydrate kinase [unclassified Mesorhizobium]MDG4855764.1 FGGY family carbohydrate kinase [Mesorhizobium sp. WSM4982]MDG4915341.1 FGGY family carbohydrate kinase [Mesorhizobium sp. WSM4983]
MGDVVIGIDASTTAVKAIAFARDGSELFQARETYPLSNPAPGHFEQDAEHWWAALLSALQQVAKAIDASRVKAIAIAHQRESFTLIDNAGKPLIPAILWLDERARRQVARLSEELGREAIRDWSGKPPDPTPALYALAWLVEHRPQALAEAASVVDVHAFFVHRLTGRLVTSTASADPLGLLDIAHGVWHPRLVEAAGLRPEQLPELAAPGEVCGTLSESVAAAIGLKAGAPVIAGAGDGQAMGLGMGVYGPGKSYLSLGSGVVSGNYSGTVTTSDAFRTLVSPTCSGFMLETVLRSGMQLVDWIVRTTGAPSAAVLERAAKEVAPGSDGLLVMPYWAGVMSPYWDGSARGAIVGLSLDHEPKHLFRAVLEGIALEQAIATEAMEEQTGKADTMIAAGGGTNCALLMEIMASVLERPLFVSPVNEAAALGAAMLAASAIGWFASPEEAAKAMAARPARQVDPVEALVPTYRARKEVYRDLYHATRDIHTRLGAIT